MMRTIEVLLVIVILLGAFTTASYFTVLSSPRQVSPLNIRRLAFTTLQTLNSNYELSGTVFKANNDPAWNSLQLALSACLPPNMLYNLTVYQMQNGNTSKLYNPIHSISNAVNLGTGSDVSSQLVSSSNVTFQVNPQKIGQNGNGGSLYILNCGDSNGWWITGYTAQSLANDLSQLLSPYFQRTIMVQSTTQLGQILNGTALQGETIQNAVVINTCGEAVPIPSGYYSSPGVGYDTSQSSYAKYCYTLGQKVHQYNWTWASIVGYPLYYVSNTGSFTNQQNTWGIYGMQLVGSAGLNAFLEGIDNQAYAYNSTWITGSPGVVGLSSQASYYSNYYGIYPSAYQTSTRALSSSILNTYHFKAPTYIFNPVNSWIAGAVYSNNVAGSFLAIGLTRTPDIRVTALSLLTYFKPSLYPLEYNTAGTSRLVVLQLGQAGGS